MFDRLKQSGERARANQAAYREELRKPRWCERYRQRYDVAVYFGGFEEPWPVIVFDRERKGIEVGRRYFSGANYEMVQFAKNAAEEIVRHYEDWYCVPECELPLLPVDEVPNSL